MSLAAISIPAAMVLLSVASSLTPAPDMRISEWVDEGKVILTARTNTPREGAFNFLGVEYLREILDRLHPDDPCERVTVRGGAQTAKSSVGQLWVCWSVDCKPMSFAIGLPAQGEVSKYDTYKLAPILEDSPALKYKVRPVSTKSRDGSNAKQKKLYTGHSILLFNLGSANELQMISSGNIILEEVANTKKEVGTRGNPVKQARERQAAYTVIGSKELMLSTGGEKGTCEVTRAFEEGDQRLFYGKCPACTDRFPITPENFRHADPEWGVCVPCPSCSVPLHEHQRGEWRRAGVWIATFKSVDPANPKEENPANPRPPEAIAEADLARWLARPTEGRHPSYQVWQAMCGLISWAKVAGTIRDAKTPDDLKALDQQVYGRDHDPAIDQMSFEDVHRLREEYEPGVCPTDVALLTGFCDVQPNYLEWGVLGWGPGGEWWVIDRNVIEGDTSSDALWQVLDEVTRRRYPHEAGGELAIEAFGVDTGYRTQKAYAFCRGRPDVYAMDGRAGWKHPFLGKPTMQKVIQNGKVKGRVKLWPSGTWGLKSLLHWSLKISTEAGPNGRLQGRGHWSKNEDEAWAQQITAETLHEEKNDKTGETDRWWKKIRDRNEWVDIWVGARALAWSLGVGAPRKDRRPGEAFDYAARAAERLENAGMTPPPDLFARPVSPPTERDAAKTPAVEPSQPPGRRPGRFFKRKR